MSANPYPTGNKEAEAWLEGLRYGVELAKAYARDYYDRENDNTYIDWNDVELQQMKEERCK